MKKISACILCFFAVAAVAQPQKKLNMKPKEVEWADNPIVHPVPPEYANEPAIVLKQDVSLDYRFEGNGTVTYYTMHRIVKVLDEKGIENFNTIGFPVGRQTRVPLVKARTILPNGKVNDIAKDMIKVTRDEYGHYKVVIAMEGVEKNSEIEILVKAITPAQWFGSQQFQYSIPVLSSHFSMSYPKELVFEEKGYNGYPQAYDTLLNNRRHIDVLVKDVPALHAEPWSFYDVNCMRVEYRIHNLLEMNENDTRKLNTWDEMARDMFNDHYRMSDTERKAVNRFLSDIGVHPGGNEWENIKKIEDGIKKTIVLYPYVDDERGDMLDTVITKKAATANGYIRLFAACYTQALIKHELGMVGDRTERRFDSKFENWDNLENYVFYFPNEKKFLSPTSTYLRCPIVPTYLAGSKGIFCMIPPKEKVAGPMMEVRTVTPLGAAANQKNIAAAVTFDKDMDAKVDISYSFTGYQSTNIRTKLLLETRDKEKELVDKLVAVADKPSDIEKYTISNESIDNYYTNKPLEITATVNASHFVERAGKQYVVKVGSIIGDHDELYTDKKRMLPIDILYPASYTRTITVNIPKGYIVVNPEATRLQSEYVDKNLVSLISFKSDYTIIPDKKNGDKLVITVTENYPKTHFPVADYERFREVVNTASDFGNVALVLAKKGQM